MKKVSVIMPSLNVAEYIEESILSVRRQELGDIEILCVDAGSDDGTLEKIQEAMAEDDRIRLILSEKKSYGYQMNLGVREACGEYIGIVETDDFIPADMYSELYEIAKGQDLDFVKADFWRFTARRDGAYDRRYIHLAADPGYRGLYNRVISPGDYPETLTFDRHTWCGIYKRDFLLGQGIWHNETPGASFQDTGFWFQTFMYAGRAMFVDKPYYMYREDNPNSSVKSKGKVYCDCDEYEWLYEMLRRDERLYDRYIYVFSMRQFGDCFFTLRRIHEDDKLAYIKRIAEDFDRARRRKELVKEMFPEERWKALVRMAANPERYYNREISGREHFREQLRLFDTVIIYGAGAAGIQLLNILTDHSAPIDPLCFAVSSRADNAEEISGKKVREIAGLLEYRETAAILVGVTEIYADEIVGTLEELGFRHVFRMPGTGQREESGCAEIPKDSRKEELVRWAYENRGDTVNLDNPETLADIVQWQKLYGINETQARLLRKETMPEEVSKRAGERYAPRIYGKYKSVREIPFDRLPRSFIMQCSHSQAEGEAISDNRAPDFSAGAAQKRRIEAAMKAAPSAMEGFPLFAEGADRNIIVREYPAFHEEDVKYVFVCLDGKVKYRYTERAGGGQIYVRGNLTDREGNPVPGMKAVCKKPLIPVETEKEKQEEMTEVAEILAAGFRALAIKMYIDAGRIVVDSIDHETAVMEMDSIGHEAAAMEMDSIDHEAAVMEMDRMNPEGGESVDEGICCHTHL